ncbi:MAG: phosphate-starvation-inducible PsiE family protein [Zestosphaera sp.]
MGLSATHARARKIVNIIMYVIDVVILVALGIMIAVTTYYLVRDLGTLISYTSTINELKLIVDYILLLFIFSELLRSVLAVRGEEYLIVLMETAVVIAIREIYISVISKTTIDLLISSISLVAVIAGLWLIKTRVYMRRPREHKIIAS